jgi:hypothetical protein
MNTVKNLKFDNWSLREYPQREKELTARFQEIFTKFWHACGIEDKSAKTRNRYLGGLNVLGGYLIEKAVLSEDDEPELSMTAEELLNEYVDEYEGPLIFMDNETWQNEFDGVCRKLHKFLKDNPKQ